MTEREKLIELLTEAEDHWLKYVDDCAFNQLAISFTFEQMFADHLLSNGVIVPPCKVGDKIYMLVTRHTTSFEFPNGKMVRKENQHTIIKQTYLTKSNFFKVLDDFGKTVFLTKEEAEKALKERNK